MGTSQQRWRVQEGGRVHGRGGASRGWDRDCGGRSAVAVLGILPAIFLRERYQALAEEENRPALSAYQGALQRMRYEAMQFFRGFMISLRFTPFLKLCGATFLVHRNGNLRVMTRDRLMVSQ